MSVDHRRHKRIEVNAYVDYTGSDVMLYHRIENISLGGICIEVPSPEPPGTQVELCINFPDLGERAIEVRGEVVWVGELPPRLMGIRFIDVTPDTQLSLVQYLAASHRRG